MTANNLPGLGAQVGWRCEDCCYAWPLSRPPLTSDECDNCGGPFEVVYDLGTTPLPPESEPAEASLDAGVEHVVSVRYRPDAPRDPLSVECSCIGPLIDVPEHRVGTVIVTHLYQTLDSDEKGTP